MTKEQKIYRINSSRLRTVFDLAGKKKKLDNLEKETQKPGFWSNQEEAIKISQEIEELKEETREIEELKKELDDLKELSKEATEEEISQITAELEGKLKKKETRTFLSGRYDKGSAILSVYAGAGGQDAQDWATMLLRMYERYSASKGFKVKILHQSFGEGGGPEGRIGTKSVSLEVQGNFAYGFLKKESGVHRLVRISPFSPKNLRHTSFALVEVLPDLGKESAKEVEIKPDEIKLETFRASGPGGQYVNRRESAVRISHLPTGIKVECQAERLQGLNREKAMKILAAKLYKLREEGLKKALKEIRGEKISAGWGNQIRSYVLHPYKLVKDLRTGVETSDTERVLDGNLEEFIISETFSFR